MRPVLPRVRPEERFSRSCTHGSIDRDAFVHTNGAVHFNTSLRCRARRRDRSACDGSWLHQDLAPVETPAASMVIRALGARRAAHGNTPKAGTGRDRRPTSVWQKTMDRIT